MSAHFQPWIPIDKVEAMAQPEPALAILGVCVISWLVYKILLRGVSAERHRNLRTNFKNLAGHAAIAGAFYLAYVGLLRLQELRPQIAFDRPIGYAGLVAILWGTVVITKVARILAFEYLFLSHMRVRVPLLLVNLLTLIATLLILGWVATEIFSIRIAPLLATSAIFSLVLGLAMQDTLGNLFAGIALQIDKPFEMGDWIEIHSEGRTLSGQVVEISWRSTVLQPPTEELITVPNRMMAQTQIANFAARERPIIRSQVFKLPHGTPVDAVKKLLPKSAEGIAGIRPDPAPFVFVGEANESWLLFKLIYFIDDYGAQWRIADQIISAGVSALEEKGYSIAPQRMAIVRR